MRARSRPRNTQWRARPTQEDCADSCRTPQALAENAGRPEDQDEDEDHESHDVRPLLTDPGMPTDPRCGGDEVLRDTEHEAADHGAPNVADTTEHRGGEGLDARDEAHRVREHEGVTE